MGLPANERDRVAERAERRDTARRRDEAASGPDLRCHRARLETHPSQLSRCGLVYPGVPLCAQSRSTASTSVRRSRNRLRAYRRATLPRGVCGSWNTVRRAEIDLEHIDVAATAILHGVTVDAISVSCAPLLGSPWDPIQTAAQAWLSNAPAAMSGDAAAEP
jgi:hypothetical protein